MPQTSVGNHDEATKVRRAIGGLWQSVLGKLAREVQGVPQGEALPETLVKNLKVASDQLRLDYRLDPPAEDPDSGEEPPADPLEGLRLVG